MGTAATTPGARGTGRATHHPPVVRMRQKQPLSAGGDVQAVDGWARSSAPRASPGGTPSAS
ncbi:hypothetical protein SBRY_50838 [Actinacidiphila bryophytorum]|uniref:Uncharacterized protein n=1 Tax=Actinacidiphila bryophytorum TaxID=1436133 RepID=A0A9W4H5M0_9ACTN|nr:hypothetical protein SBRY_50838 [Actinacidiphila bryophytorum]